MMKLWFAGLLGSAMIPGALNDTVLLDDLVPGCIDPAALMEIQPSWRVEREDRVAYLYFAARECVLLDSGSRLIVDNQDKQFLCLRWYPEKACYWVRRAEVAEVSE